MSTLLKNIDKKSVNSCNKILTKKYPGLNDTSLKEMLSVHFIADFFGTSTNNIIKILSQIITTSIPLSEPKKSIFMLILSFEMLMLVTETFFYLKMSSFIESQYKCEMNDHIYKMINHASDDKDRENNVYYQILQNIKSISTKDLFEYVVKMPEYSYYAKLSSLSTINDKNVIKWIKKNPIFMYVLKYADIFMDKKNTILNIDIHNFDNGPLEIII